MKKNLIVFILFFVLILPVKASSESPPSFLDKENIFEGRGSYFLCDTNYNLHNYEIKKENLVRSEISGSCLIVTTLNEPGYGYTILKNKTSNISYTINYQIVAGYFEIQQKDFESGGYFTQETYNLGGLTYEIYDKSNNLLETLSIHKAFKTVKSKLYMPGMYYLKQVSAIEGYEIQKEAILISLNKTNEVKSIFFYNKPITINELVEEEKEIKNEPIASASSEKEDLEDTSPLTEEIINPYTGDNIIMYSLLLIGSLLIILFIKKALY